MKTKNLRVNGRHLGGEARFDSKNIETGFAIHEDSVTLRLDDRANLAWWLEVDIPKEVLVELLKELEHGS